MGDFVVESLIVDLLDWLARQDRTYEDVMEAWRTSCPRLTVWEDANDRGLVMLEASNGLTLVRVTPAGRTLLALRRQIE
jgi:hypothetical protein